MGQTMDQNQAQNQGQQQFRQQENEQQKMQTKQQTKSAPSKQQFNFSFEKQDKVEKELNKPRSRAYMEIFEAADILSATDEEIIARLRENMDEDTAEEFMNMSAEEILEEIRATFREEFQNLEIEVNSILHGVLSKCYIDGCDCHSISADGWNIEHYDMNQSMPEELAKGRKVFHKYPNCICVEVYSDCCRVVMDDSSVVQIKNAEI